MLETNPGEGTYTYGGRTYHYTELPATERETLAEWAALARDYLQRHEHDLCRCEGAMECELHSLLGPDR